SCLDALRQRAISTHCILSMGRPTSIAIGTSVGARTHALRSTVWSCRISVPTTPGRSSTRTWPAVAWLRADGIRSLLAQRPLHLLHLLPRPPVRRPPPRRRTRRHAPSAFNDSPEI